MMRFSRLLAILVASGLICSLAVSGGIVHASVANHQAAAQSATGSYILHFKPGVSIERMLQIYGEMGVNSQDAIPQIDSQVVKIKSEGLTGEANLSNYHKYPEIESLEPDYLAQATETPDDSDFPQQWGLSRIQAPEAWDITHGKKTIKIAILDSGIDSSHPDLASKVVEKKNFTDSPTTEDKFGHGTHVAGIAAAITDNNTGVSGVGYNTSLMNVKVLGDTGAGSYSWITQGIIWAADNGANVINLSMCGNIESEALKQAVDYAWNKGAVIIVAAGNNGNSNISYPAGYDNAIAVAATSSSDKLFSFSDFGDWIDVAAPGQAYSTLPGNSYGSMVGTSMAAPYVAGLAGLAFAVAKDTNCDGKVNDEVREAIQKGCDVIGASGTGSGRINASRTLSLLKPGAPSISTQVTTIPATGTYSHGAVLNGFIDSSTSGSPVEVSFEFGPTEACGRYTEAQVSYSSGAFSATLVGLAADSTYYFRAKVVGTDTEFGDTMILMTPPDPVIKPSGLDALRIGFSRSQFQLLPGSSMNYCHWPENYTRQAPIRLIHSEP